MSEVSGVVVAHGDLATALVGAVEKISGVQGALHAISNEACAPPDLARQLEEATQGHPTIVFVDLASGSCALAGRQIARRLPDVVVVSGVSLPMLLDFVFHRGMEVGELAERVVAKARAAATAEVFSTEPSVDRPL